MADQSDQSDMPLPRFLATDAMFKVVAVAVTVGSGGCSGVQEAKANP